MKPFKASSLTYDNQVFLSSYTLNPAWKPLYIIDKGEMMSISYLFEQRASLGEFQLKTIETPYETIRVAILPQFSSSTTNFWSKVPGIDAFPCISALKLPFDVNLPTVGIISCENEEMLNPG